MSLMATSGSSVFGPAAGGAETPVATPASTGASFTATTVMFACAVGPGTSPLLATTVMSRSVVSGLSLELLNRTCLIAVS